MKVSRDRGQDWGGERQEEKTANECIHFASNINRDNGEVNHILKRGLIWL